MSKKYDEYLDEHRKNVVKAGVWLVDHHFIDNSETIIKFLKLIDEHDLSKYDSEEYSAYDRYFYTDPRTTELNDEFDYAWLHHIHHNPHHWQYWILVDDGEYKPLDMPDEYIYEMICDWWSFSWRSGDLYEIFGWWNSHKDKIQLSNATHEKVCKILNQIKEILDEEAVNKNG